MTHHPTAGSTPALHHRRGGLVKPHDYEYLKAMVDHPAGRRAPHPFQAPQPTEHLYLGERTEKDEENEAQYYRDQTDKTGGILLTLLVIFTIGLLLVAIGKLAWAVLPWLM